MKCHIYWIFMVLHLASEWYLLGKYRIVDCFVNRMDYVFVCIKYEGNMQLSHIPLYVIYPY